MAETMSSKVVLQDGMHFTATAQKSGGTIQLDSPHGEDAVLAGPSPMETVLSALGGCSGMDVISIMRKKRQNIHGLEIEVEGTRGEEYPKPYTQIRLHYRAIGTDLDPAALVRSVELSRDRYCPVWKMLSASVEISFTTETVAAAAE
jgi:putative redox protein